MMKVKYYLEMEKKNGLGNFISMVLLFYFVNNFNVCYEIKFKYKN